MALTNGNDGRSNPSTPQITSDKTKKQRKSVLIGRKLRHFVRLECLLLLWHVEMLENCKQRVLHHYCDADITYDEDADTRRCFKFAKSCRSVQGMERCTITFQPVDRHQHDNVVKVVYDKFGKSKCPEYKKGYHQRCCIPGGYQLSGQKCSENCDGTAALNKASDHTLNRAITPSCLVCRAEKNLFKFSGSLAQNFGRWKKTSATQCYGKV